MIDLRNLSPLPVTRAGMALAALDLYRQQIAYGWGAKSPEPTNAHGWVPGALDCSGFITHPVWQLTAGKLDLRDTHNAARLCAETPRQDNLYHPEAGDLAFYGTPDHVSHVMLCLGGGVVIGQAYGDQTCVDPAQSRARGFTTKALPILYRRDLVAICRPRYAP